MVYFNKLIFERQVASMLSLGMVLVVAGLGIVFAYLYLMVILMRLIGRFVPRFAYLMPDAVPARPQQRPAAPVAAGDDRAAIAIAIAAATARRRS